MSTTIRVLFSTKSRNRKTGNIPISHTEWKSCSKTCPFYKKGCYGRIGPLSTHWFMFAHKSFTWTDFCRAVSNLPPKTIWRHNSVGDLPGTGNKINFYALKRLIKANSGKRGYTYTHKPVLGKLGYKNRKAIKYANDNGFAVSLSAVGLKQADRLYDLDIAPVVVVLPEKFEGNDFITPKGRRGVICPAEQELIDCKNCGICAITNRDFIVGFKAHGAQKNYVSKIAAY